MLDVYFFNAYVGTMNKKFDKPFIHPLRKWRFNNGEIRIAELAEEIGVTPGFLSAVERGKSFPGPDLLETIQKVTRITPNQMLAARKRLLEEAKEMA